MTKDMGYLFLRMTLGATMLFSHGLPKIMHYSQKVLTFPDPLGVGKSLTLGLAIGSEVLCALMLILGFFTRWVSIPLVLTMAVAFFIIHSGAPFARRELALIYMGGYIATAFLGSGRFSLDFLIRKKS